MEYNLDRLCYQFQISQRFYFNTLCAILRLIIVIRFPPMPLPVQGTPGILLVDVAQILLEIGEVRI